MNPTYPLDVLIHDNWSPSPRPLLQDPDSPDPRTVHQALEEVAMDIAEQFRRCAQYYRCNLVNLCATCCWIRREVRLLRNYRTAFEACSNLHWVTLTRHAVPVLTRDAIIRQKERVVKFRRRPRVQQLVVGGMSFIESKLGDKGWSIHAHLLVEAVPGLKLSRSFIRDEWFPVSGGFSVDVEPLDGDWEAAFRYGTKLPVLPREPRYLQQFVSATVGRRLRLVTAWGSILAARRSSDD